MRHGLRHSSLLPALAVAAALPLVLVGSAGPAGATTRHVPGTYATIQLGIDAAVAGDTVLVAAGTFSDLWDPPDADTTRCVAYMKSGVTLRGAGRGLTVLDPLGSGRGIHCDGVTNARIESLTVTDAFAEIHGAGILCAQGSSPVISDCEVTACGDGGIICLTASSPEIADCILTGNEAKAGGGLAVEGGSAPVVRRCSIDGNAAPVAGGVYVKGNSAPVFEDCTIDDNFLNTINGVGGGIAATNSLLTLRRCSVSRNVATGSGGGIHLTEVYPAVIESTLVQDNTTSAGDAASGGGIYCELADLDLDGCTITGNAATGSGGDGGGIFLFFAMSTTITGCTIADNEAPATPDGLGGGIACFAFAAPVIERSIVAFNGPGQGMYCADGTSSPSVSCSDFFGNEDGDAICGTSVADNFSADPLFCDLSGGDFGLAAGSPCLPGNHPNGADCGTVGAHGDGGCGTAAPEVAAAWTDPGYGPAASPNPFRAGGTIRFALDAPRLASLVVYDVSGRRVRVLESERLFAPGLHEATWDARDGAGREVASGIYFCRLAGDGVVRTGRLVIRR